MTRVPPGRTAPPSLTAPCTWPIDEARRPLHEEAHHALQRHHLRVLRRCVSALVLVLAAPSAADYGILANPAWSKLP